MNTEEIEQTHFNLREILIKNGCEEYGDVIIDEITEIFNYPNTIDLEKMNIDNFLKIIDDEFASYDYNDNEIIWFDDLKDILIKYDEYKKEVKK